VGIQRNKQNRYNFQKSSKLEKKLNKNIEATLSTEVEIPIIGISFDTTDKVFERVAKEAKKIITE